jgi:acylphosphatase
MRTVQIIAKGKVQGVGFRNFVKKSAEALNLKGFTKNKVSGDVFTICQGDLETLNKIVETIKIGNSYSKVTEVSIDWLDNQPMYSDFQILPTD